MCALRMWYCKRNSLSVGGYCSSCQTRLSRRSKIGLLQTRLWLLIHYVTGEGSGYRKLRFISAVKLAVCFGPQCYFLNMKGACWSGERWTVSFCGRARGWVCLGLWFLLDWGLNSLLRGGWRTIQFHVQLWPLNFYRRTVHETGLCFDIEIVAFMFAFSTKGPHISNYTTKQLGYRQK